MSSSNTPDFVFRNVYRTRPYNQRRDDPETHKKHLAYLGKISVARINSDQRRTLSPRSMPNSNVTEAQYQAVRSAFLRRLPYLAPENVFPASTSIESLLAKKLLDRSYVRYGAVSVSLKDAPMFERMQIELATINEQIAVRQLYQLMHGYLLTHILFSEIGHSGAIPNVDGRNLIHVNTRYTVLDPQSFVVTPLCVVLGHEIEHVNVPVGVSQLLRSFTDQGFTTAEEARTIDGYENGMLHSLGRGERSTHKSYLVTLDPEDHTKIVFPFITQLGRRYLRPGQHIHGKLLNANRHTLTIELDDGNKAVFETRFLLAASSGLQRPHRMNFSGRRIESQMDSAPRGTCRGSMENSEPEYNDVTAEHFPFVLLEQKALASPAVDDQLSDWRKGAARGEFLTISMNLHGLLSLHNQKKEIDQMQYIILRKLSPGDQERPRRKKEKAFIRGARTLISLAYLAKACDDYNNGGG